MSKMHFLALYMLVYAIFLNSLHEACPDYRPYLIQRLLCQAASLAFLIGGEFV